MSVRVSMSISYLDIMCDCWVKNNYNKRCYVVKNDVPYISYVFPYILIKFRMLCPYVNAYK
jgi:hypothetical protein